jgi:hypothetical protein
MNISYGGGSMNLFRVRAEIKRIKDRETELLEEKEALERDFKPEDWFTEFKLQEIEDSLKYVRERLEKALNKESELELKEVRGKSCGLER